jgi:hypothetical protein
MMRTVLLLLLGIVFSYSTSSLGDERILPRAELLRLGYRPFVPAQHLTSKPAAKALPKDLNWPVEFQDSAHNIAQN